MSLPAHSVYASRRAALLSTMQANSIALIPGASEVTRSRDTHYPFRQDSYFYYLTGFNEPDTLLVLSNQQAQPYCLLFCRGKDPNAEIWQGRRLGPEQARTQLAIDDSLDINELDNRLPALLDGHQTLYFAQGAYPSWDEQVFHCLQQLRTAPKQSMQAPQSLTDLRPILDDMRLHKDQTEQALMQQAADISAQAHIRAMRHCQPGLFEYQLQAEIEHQFAYQGATGPAYSSIVGSGANACILHYTENSSQLNSGALVLIDAGAEYQGYAADITRTFPVNGRFSPAQAALYRWVLRAQQAAIDCIRPGNTLAMANQAAIRVITQGLLELGLLTGSVDACMEQQAYRDYFMHGTGHWLGLDVHDVGDYKRNQQDRPLAPGMVLTIEPGIYIAPDAPVASKWQGIGIRIEDNLLVTEQGHHNLTAAAPKDIQAIEALMQAKT